MKTIGRQIRLWAVVLCVCMFAGEAAPVMASSARNGNNAYRAVFDADYYYNAYPDLQTAIGKNQTRLFNHFVTYGIKEGRSGNSEFNISVYKTNNPDLAEVFGDDLKAYCTHYISFGRAEGRTASSGESTQPATAQQTAAGTVISTCTTYYEAGVPRAKNIELAVSRINGVTLQPGEEFSFSKTILPRSRANGYVEGPAYMQGKTIQSVGGGICQVSSTLYAAMLNGSIPASERHAHSMPVPYLPEGMDATISGTWLDLKFVNRQDCAVQIQATAANGVLTVTLNRV